MKSLMQKFKSNLDATRQDESGDVVQTVLIIAVFVVIVVVVGRLLFTAINDRAGKTADCINSVEVGSIEDGC